MSSKKQLQQRQQNLIEGLEGQCVDAIMYLEKNSKEVLVFRKNMEKLVSALSLLNIERMKLRISLL